MEFTYETNGSNTFLVYAIPEKEQVDTMTLGMMTNNKITGMAPIIFTQMNLDKYFKYNVSAKISVTQFFTGSVNKKRLLGVFSSIANAVATAEEYMIDVSNIILDTDYIFADVSSCNAEVICMPLVSGVEGNMDIKMFLKNIMFSTQFDQTENCDYVARIINYLNSAASFSAEDFLKVIEELKGGSVAPKQVAPAPQPAPAPQVVQQPAPQPVMQQPIQQQPVKPMQQPVSQPAPAQQSKAPSLTKPSAAPANNAGFAVPGQSAPAQSGFAVPGGKTVAEAPKKGKKGKEPQPQAQPQAPNAGSQEKPMSMFYLLQHYNKENAAIYKAQQDEKKTSGKKSKDTKAPATAPAGNGGFAVPGQSTPAPSGFAVPGQSPAAAPMQQSRVSQPAVSTPAPQPVQPVVQQPVSQPAPMQNQFGGGANFGETTVLGVGGNIGETTVLSANPQVSQVNPCLVRAKNNERIMLNKPLFRVGKEKSFVDYFIGDNTAISRSHADFVVRDQKVYVIDRNSTNHTYVNGQMIQSNVEVALEHGDKVKLANEEFQLTMF